MCKILNIRKKTFSSVKQTLSKQRAQWTKFNIILSTLEVLKANMKSQYENLINFSLFYKV